MVFGFITVEGEFRFFELHFSRVLSLLPCISVIVIMPTTCGYPNCKFRSRYRGTEDNRHFYRVRDLEIFNDYHQNIISNCAVILTGAEKACHPSSGVAAGDRPNGTDDSQSGECSNFDD